MPQWPNCFSKTNFSRYFIMTVLIDKLQIEILFIEYRLNS